MNDRIIELAKQAGFFIDVISEPMRIGVFHQKIDKELKRFAELVRADALDAPVQEPVPLLTDDEIDVALHVALPSLPYDSEDAFINGVRAGEQAVRQKAGI